MPKTIDAMWTNLSFPVLFYPLPHPPYDLHASTYITTSSFIAVYALYLRKRVTHTSTGGRASPVLFQQRLCVDAFGWLWQRNRARYVPSAVQQLTTHTLEQVRVPCDVRCPSKNCPGKRMLSKGAFFTFIPDITLPRNIAFLTHVSTNCSQRTLSANASLK